MEASELLPTVAWRTMAKDVYPLTAETVDKPATFRMSIHPADINDVGAGRVEIGFYAKDYIGSTFSVIAFTSSTVDLQDDFRRGFAPQTGQWAVVYKSVGDSLYLAPIYYTYLSSQALDYSRQIELAVLWRNGVKSVQIPFMSDSPMIVDYNTLYADDYGQMPKVQLFTLGESGTVTTRTELAYFQLTDGLIDSIGFGTLEQVHTGFINLSR